MKIRKNILNGEEQKVFIHENKKDENILVAVPDLHWSISFTYSEDLVKEKITHSLRDKLDEENAENLSNRIYQWTREM